MTRIVEPNFARPDIKTKSMLQRMARFDLADRVDLIASTFAARVFRTSFTLADQVLLHALIKNKIDVTIVNAVGQSAKDRNLESLIGITRDLYGLEFSGEDAGEADVALVTVATGGKDGKFIGKDQASKLMTINPLADWSYDALVGYVLAHEVPVNPADMPGAASKVA